MGSGRWGAVGASGHCVAHAHRWSRGRWEGSLGGSADGAVWVVDGQAAAGEKEAVHRRCREVNLCQRVSQTGCGDVKWPGVLRDR